jgi:hypothetical protein
MITANGNVAAVIDSGADMKEFCASGVRHSTNTCSQILDLQVMLSLPWANVFCHNPALRVHNPSAASLE